MYNVQELATARQHNIPLVDDRLQRRRVRQRAAHPAEQFDGRTIASDLLNPDFVELAEVFGIPGMRAEAPDALQGALREALATDGR